MNVRFRPEERAAIEADAERDGQSLSDWAREVLLRAAK